jgi:hypothetical protein
VSELGRREFITLISSAAVACPLAARAQQAANTPTIGYLGPSTPAVESQRYLGARRAIADGLQLAGERRSRRSNVLRSRLPGYVPAHCGVDRAQLRRCQLHHRECVVRRQAIINEKGGG